MCLVAGAVARPLFLPLEKGSPKREASSHPKALGGEVFMSIKWLLLLLT